MTEDFYAAIAKEESRIKDIAQKAVEYAKSLGVDEAEATIGLQKGLSVSTRKADVENIEFNKNRGLDITVFKNKKNVYIFLCKHSLNFKRLLKFFLKYIYSIIL